MVRGTIKLSERSFENATRDKDSLNNFVPEPRLRIPDVKFNRSIGDHAGMRYSIDGDLLSETEYEKHLSEVLPDAEDERVLSEIFKDKDWVLQMN